MTALLNAPEELSQVSGAQDLLAHIIARNDRYEVANYPNIAIPVDAGLDQSPRPVTSSPEHPIVLTGEA